MQKTNLKLITSLILSSVVLMSGVSVHDAFAKEVRDGVKVEVNEKKARSYKFLVYKATETDNGVQIEAVIKNSVMKKFDLENIVKANGDVLRIKNAKNMKFEREDYHLYGIVTLYQVIDGYKVDTNSITYQPKKKNNDVVSRIFLTTHFNNDIFDNLDITKEEVKFSLEDAIGLAKAKANDYHSDVKAETVITKIGNKYYKAHKVKIFNKGYYIDVRNGNILDTFSIYVGPL